MDSQKSGQTDRRDFFRKALAVIIGGIAGIVPAIAGLRTFLDPLKHKSDVAPSGVPLIQVTTLDALPNDGVPRKFPVLANKTDAWNKYVNVPIGAVYLRRTPDDKVEALNVVCPHAGCFVDFVAEKGNFLCPCHNSLFTMDGKLADAKSPSPRALDSLKVEVKDGVVSVAFQNFEAGRPDRVPVS
ncbi:MAG: (2Fe-2S)-binding protein [Pedosphaera sp.]|nr:(2Fe-2S)-binding protein [Pedosphaera sp.]